MQYSSVGQGPTLVLLHGFCEDLHIWEDLALNLSSNFKVVCIDLPGFGKSPLRFTKPTMDDLAWEVNDLLESIGVTEPFVLVGHSLGGYVALAYAERYTEKLAGLGLFHSSVFSDTLEKQTARNKTIDFLEKHGSEKFIRPFFPSLFAEANRDSNTKTIDSLIERALAIPTHTLIKITEAMRDRPDRSKFIAKFPKPVLFIVGKEDQAVPLETSIRQSVLPVDSKVCFLEGTGHAGMFESPEKSANCLKEFVSYCQRP